MPTRKEKETYLGGADKLLNAPVPVPLLTGEVTGWARCVLHVHRVQLREPVCIGGHLVPSLGLVHPDLARMAHYVEVLLRVGVSLGGDPAGGVRRRPDAVVVVAPLHQQRDGILDGATIRRFQPVNIVNTVSPIARTKIKN